MLEGQLARLSGLAEEFGEDRLTEALSRLELALEDEGWNRLGSQTKYDFSRAGLKRIVELSRAMAIANPLIKNAVNIQKHYVFAQGFQIVPRAQVIADVVSRFLDDKGNRRELTGIRALVEKEHDLQTDGNLFFALFTNASTGAVRVRSVAIDEISDIVKNPEDSHEPWLYLREWTEYPADSNGVTVATIRKTYYPDWLYQPTTRPAKRNDIEIRWDAPMYHLRVGASGNMTFGIPEVYAALDWARAVVQGLEDYATIRRAHARFAWRLSTKGGPKGVTAAKSKLSTTLASDLSEQNPPPVTGSTFIQSTDGASLEPIKTAGGQASPDEGRRVGLMVTSGVGIPETMLLGDSTVGNYATAKSLDRPTELKMRLRQTLWTEVFRDILSYVVDQAALKPNGPLMARKVRDSYSGEVELVVLAPDTKQPVDRTIDVTFPNILERDVQAWVQSIVGAATLNGQPLAGLIDSATLARLLLTALQESDVDETVARLFPQEVNPPADDGEDPPPTVGPEDRPLDNEMPDPLGPVDSPNSP